jgi:hypothetical protein
MNKEKKNILILVEGSRVDVRLMKKLFTLYGIDALYNIFSYDTNIYVLYDKMFDDENPEDIDIIQVLLEQKPSDDKKRILEQKFTDILLVFDLDPQDQRFTKDKITAMMKYFVESTDMGKLYLNYPMVEAFYHMGSIPDNAYNKRTVTLDELRNRTYKQRVNEENRNRNYSKFAVNREECNIVIDQNIQKGLHIIGANPGDDLPDTGKILESQLTMLRNSQMLYVLCTCVYFIPEYNPKLLKAQG